MFTRAAGMNKTFGLMAIGFALVFGAGCAKKVPPVSGASGMTSDSGDASDGGGSSSDSMSSDSGMGSSDDVTSMNQDSPNSGMSDDSSSGASNGMGSAMTGDPLDFANTVYFDYDKAEVRSDAKTVLSENARWLAINPNIKIQIEGHGDERGTNEYNLALGERRARSILRYLVNLGINESRFSFISYGEERGVCMDPNEDCYQKNRRVHFLVNE